MLTYLQKTISLANLRRNSGGQIATLLVLFMVVILIFILITVNLGQLSITATNLSNTADSASLSLGSQLSTKAHMLWLGMGRKTKITEIRGFVKLVLEAIVAIALLPVGGPIWAAIGSGLVGGGLGGIYGGWNGALAGFCQGFTFGAGILTSGVSNLIIAAELYNQNVADQMTMDAITTINKSLNALSEYERARETTYFEAFLQTVDDPNRVQDNYDSDADGNTTEQVPAFQLWWDARLDCLKGIVERRGRLIDEFLKDSETDIDTDKGPLAIFRNYAQDLYASGGGLSRQEIEGADGPFVKLARGLEAANHSLPSEIWTPGPEKTEFDAWRECEACSPDGECEACPPPTGYDEVDAAVELLTGLVEESLTIKNTSPATMYTTWETWLPLFYTPDNPDNEQQGDYYHTLDSLKQNLTRWKEEIIHTRSLLPVCEFNSENNATNATNAPCRIEEIGGRPLFISHAGTVDGNPNDEFTPVINSIDEAITKIDAFRGACWDLYSNIPRDSSVSCGSTCAGRNCLQYQWEDSRGEHEVKVEMVFMLPYLEPFKTKFTKGVKLWTGYNRDDSSAWVRITRIDPLNKDENILNKWLSTLNWGDRDSRGNLIIKISRTSHVTYGYNESPRIADVYGIRRR